MAAALTSDTTSALWLVLEKGTDGRPVWLGSVTFDRGVGLSHDTGQVTHHIGPDIDADRDLLMRLREAVNVENLLPMFGTGPPTVHATRPGVTPSTHDGQPPGH